MLALSLCLGLLGLSSALRTPTNVPPLTQPQGLSVEAALAQPQQAFTEFVKRNGRQYTSQEEHAARFKTFQANLAYIKRAKSLVEFDMGVTPFADLTWEEFRSTHLGLKPTQSGAFQSGSLGAFSHGNVTARKTVDWTAEGVVTPVKNQLACGSCWAFSTTGSIEGINALYTGELVSLSEQELVDCDSEVDQGCGGGLMDNAFKFILENGGLDTEKDYPYDSIGGFCNKLREGRTVVSIDGFEDVPVNDEHALRQAVSQQPVSVAICASEALQFYTGGVVGGSAVQCTALNHGVLAVGYGEDEEGVPYWKIKNSWGASWGEAGYFRARANIAEKEGPLGMCMAASYPLKSSPNPGKQPEVCGYFGWSECEYGSRCACRFSLFGLFCLAWGCAGGAGEL